MEQLVLLLTILKAMVRKVDRTLSINNKTVRVVYNKTSMWGFACKFCGRYYIVLDPRLGDMEEAILLHECGHIYFDHTVYLLDRIKKVYTYLVKKLGLNLFQRFRLSVILMFNVNRPSTKCELQADRYMLEHIKDVKAAKALYDRLIQARRKVLKDDDDDFMIDHLNRRIKQIEKYV